MTATFSADFKHEFEQERNLWLRKRFLWYTAILSCLNVVNLVGTIFVLGRQSSLPTSLLVFSLMLGMGNIAVYAAPFFFVRQSKLILNRKAIIRMLFWILIINGVLLLMGQIIGGDVGKSLSNVEVTGELSFMQRGLAWLAGVFLTHVIASLFIPWTPRECLRPMKYLVGLFILSMLVVAIGPEMPLWHLPILALISLLIPLPGMGIAWWRHSRFKDRFHYKALRGRYGQMKRELVDARRLHEALFPQPIQNGNVRFSYCYEPMRQIGGDFLFTHTFPSLALENTESEPVSIVIVDVTGHGIPAALTVNRLHGELERIFAEDPDVPPGEVLRMLNRYVHLTLSRHSVFATALCLRVDPLQNIVAWASGGHPPAFLQGVDDTLEELGSTAIVLGAVPGSEFDPGERSHKFMPGDSLLAYTDGAIEAKNVKGVMLRVEGLRKIIASVVPDSGPAGWASAVLREIDRFRHGPAEDDTLVVEMYRPLIPAAALTRSSAQVPTARQLDSVAPTKIAERS
jgi:serine phosphatase RsbU (regulator of sigma subunit)